MAVQILARRHWAALAALRRPPVLIAVVALGLLGWQWLETRARLQDMEAQLARRLGEGDAVAREGRAVAKQNQDGLQALAAKTGALDARLSQMEGEQAALDAMYQELSRSRDERLLAEVEQTVSLAAQQLAIAGNVEAALIALQSADARLARAGQPQLTPIRKLINRDIDRLKSLPSADVPGISLKLDGIVASIDAMPLAHEQRPKAEPAAAPKEAADVAYWRRLLDELWGQAKQLIRVERMDRPTAALLSPSQAFFLRENLKLRLLNARLSLLQHDGAGFRDDIGQARNWLDTYFDSRARPVQTAASTLKTLAAVEVSQDLPTLAETLAMLHNLRAAREKEYPLAAPRPKAPAGAPAKAPVPARPGA